MGWGGMVGGGGGVGARCRAPGMLNMCSTEVLPAASQTHFKGVFLCMCA